MKVAIIQTSLFWEQPQLNRELFKSKIDAISEEVDLVILPEMFTSGFTMNPVKVAELMVGETVLWLKEIAINKNCALAGSFVVSENEFFFNRLLFVYPSGEVKYYDKKHLFTFSGENVIYKAGFERLVVSYKGFTICPLICYDLRFPVFSRNTQSIDLYIYVANWPKVRIQAWDILLKARAIENMSYVVGVNRLGSDENQNIYNGHSQIIDCFGTTILNLEEENQVAVVNIEKKMVTDARTKFDFLNDKDDFDLK